MFYVLQAKQTSVDDVQLGYVLCKQLCKTHAHYIRLCQYSEMLELKEVLLAISRMRPTNHVNTTDKKAPFYTMPADFIARKIYGCGIKDVNTSVESEEGDTMYLVDYFSLENGEHVSPDDMDNEVQKFLNTISGEDQRNIVSELANIYINLTDVELCF